MKVTPCINKPILLPCGLKSFDYQVDAYIGCEHYCYYCYVLNTAETDWNHEILIHKDFTDRLRESIEDISPQTIYMGYSSDPYQPLEAEYRQTRKALEIFLEKGFSTSILTKSDLVGRDIDILQKMENAAVSVSVAFTDDRVRQQFEANTIETQARIDALGELREAGIKTGALICPVIPYITDVKTLLDWLVPCTDEIWIYGLSILDRNDQSWKNVEDILRNHFPALKDKIEPIIFSKDHPYWSQLREDLDARKGEIDTILNIHV